MNNSIDLSIALSALSKGEVIAYPTEAVFGLGCDYQNEKAVQHILDLKQRPRAKGLLLIAAAWQQVAPLVAEEALPYLSKALATWPGPYTWVFPASNQAPSWICGEHSSIALRITAHPIAQALCQQWGAALVSTSANPSGLEPARTAKEVANYFAQDLGVIVAGEVGNTLKPTPIYDILSGLILRE